MENRAEDASEWKPLKGNKSFGPIHSSGDFTNQFLFSLMQPTSKILLHVQVACLRKCLFLEVWRP
jgi:hypothetical protein